MKRFLTQMSIALICIILGFMISLQLKSVKHHDTVTTKQFQRADQLQMELTREREKNENVYKQMLQYEKDLHALQVAAAENSGYARELLEQLNRAEIIAGLTDVEGAGVIVTLYDSKVKNDASFRIDENYFIIHDEDIWRVINELADAGAEALALNNERLIGTSEIRCSGSTVSVNNNRYAPPFVIKAIGNPSTLEAALNLRGGVVDVLRQWGIEVEIKRSNKIQISRYRGFVNFKYAVPVKGGASE